MNLKIGLTLLSKIFKLIYRGNPGVLPTTQTIAIVYIAELDPGGSIPGWIANAFIEKSPYETFSNLAGQLKK